MLIDPSNCFICLLIDNCIDGRGTNTQSCLASPPKQSKAKFDVTKCNKKIIWGQKIKANKKIIMGQREYYLVPKEMHFELKFGGDGFLLDLWVDKGIFKIIKFMWCGSLQSEFLSACILKHIKYYFGFFLWMTISIEWLQMSTFYFWIYLFLLFLTHLTPERLIDGILSLEI